MITSFHPQLRAGASVLLLTEWPGLWMVNHHSALHGRHFSFSSPALKQRKGKQCGFAVWWEGWAIRTSRPLWGSAGDFSPGLDTVGLLFLRGKIETTMLASPTERKHTTLKTFNTSGHPERKLGCPGQLIIFSKTHSVFEMCQRFCCVTLERI